MPNYVPPPAPLEAKELNSYTYRELNRIAKNLADNAESIFYRTLPANQGSLTAGVSANYKLASGNVVRVSTSVTQTFTGIAVKTANREIVFLNVGTGVAVLKSEGTESSASYRFALTEAWQLSTNAAAVLWYDLTSARWRGLSRT